MREKVNKIIKDMKDQGVIEILDIYLKVHGCRQPHWLRVAG